MMNSACAYAYMHADDISKVERTIRFCEIVWQVFRTVFRNSNNKIVKKDDSVIITTHIFSRYIIIHSSIPHSLLFCLIKRCNNTCQVHAYTHARNTRLTVYTSCIELKISYEISKTVRSIELLLNLIDRYFYKNVSLFFLICHETKIYQCPKIGS